MNPEDRRLLELIKHSASQIGSCLDARDRSYDSDADEHEPLFEAAVEKAIESLSPTLQTTSEFVKWIAASGTSTSCSIAVEPYSCAGYRLLTEAEWEAAARCGEDTLYAGSGVIGDVAWYDENSDDTPHTVATKASNACGLYDMSGNVWEWTQDWYDSSYYSSTPDADPVGATSGHVRVIRGGSWYNVHHYARVANRAWFTPDGRLNGFLGLRLVRTSP